MAERWREIADEGVLVSNNGRIAFLATGSRETVGRYIARAFHGPQPQNKKLQITDLTPKGCRWVRSKYRPKLTAEDVRAIRAELANGMTNTKVAQRFGVNYSLVSRIRSGKIWRNA